MSISDKYLGFFYTYLGNMESTFRRVQLISDYLKMPVNFVQYRGAVGNLITESSLIQRLKVRFLIADIGCPKILEVLLLIIITTCVVLH